MSMRYLPTMKLALAVCVCVSACGKADDPSSAAKSTEADSKLVYKRIDTLELEIEVPSSAPFADDRLKELFGTKTVLANPSVHVETDRSMDRPADFAAAKAAIEASRHPFQEFTKQSDDAGAFHFEYTVKSKDNGSTLYGFLIRKKIGEKLVDCGTNGFRSAPHLADKTQRDRAVKVCQSLRAPM
jgi:hypothetical protein